MSDILPESGLIYTYLVTKFLTYRIFQKNLCVGEWYILYFWNDQIVVHNGVETDFWLRHYFVWYIAWKWSHLYIFSDKISYLQIFSEKPLCGRVIYFIFLKWLTCRFFQKNPLWQEWSTNGVETDFWLRHYFVWYIAWKWSHLYIFSDKISYLQIFSEKPCVGEWYILYFWDVQIGVHNGVETDFWLRHYFVWYIAWKWSHLYIFSDKISYLQNFSEKPCVGEWYILYFWNDQIVVHNGVETDFWLRHYFVWYIAWKWSHLYIFSDKISYLQIFSEKPLCGRVIYFIFLKWPNCCPQWCRDGFLIKALFCLIYCLKVVSSIHIQWQNFLLADFFRKTPVGKSDIFYIFEMSKLVSAMVSRSIFD